MNRTVDWFTRALAGDRRALARSISRIDDRAPDLLEAMELLHPRRHHGPGAPQVIGLTGPPGAGKSTFTNALVRQRRKAGARVAVVAVDPSSPFTGGAILGDRIRMEEHAADLGVYVRSLSSRGNLGGLSRATGQVIDLLDAVGFDTILVETVGVGQSELGVMEVVDTVLVVLTPESGDTVQTMKAGLLEVADVFVVNKADRPGAERLGRELEQMVHIDGGEAGWAAPVLLAAAVEGRGVAEALDATEAHAAYCQGAGLPAWQRRRANGRLRTFHDILAEELRARVQAALEGPEAALGAALRAGDTTPARAARAYLEAHPWRSRTS